MVESQEIIERSVYVAILDTLLKRGLTLNPNDYYPLTPAKAEQYKIDRQAIETEHGTYIELYGNSNSLSKGEKKVPRIVIVPQGFYPGDIGFEKTLITEDEDGGFLVSESPFEAIDQFIDIRLVANKTEDSRLLHNVLNTSIPQRGYIKPYNLDNKPFDGNIFIMLSNYMSGDDYGQGQIEKVYQFTVKDTILEAMPVVDNVVPMVDISYIISTGISPESELKINNI